MNKERQELIDQLEWNSGGYGFGVCAEGNAMLWSMDRPSKDKPDLKSIVAVCGNPEKYTTEELAKIVEFAKAATEQYDKMFRYRRGCNLILLDKLDEHSWMRKRLTWNTGPLYSTSLDEALAVFGGRHESAFTGSHSSRPANPRHIEKASTIIVR